MTVLAETAAKTVKNKNPGSTGAVGAVNYTQPPTAVHPLAKGDTSWLRNRVSLRAQAANPDLKQHGLEVIGAGHLYNHHLVKTVRSG